MHHYFEAITNRSGDSLTGYFARVIDPATQSTVTLSSDNNGTPVVVMSGVENMAKTDENGNVSFYVQPGTYHLDIYAPNATTFIYRVSNVAMNSTKGDPGDPGPPGDPGTINTFGTLAALLASPPSRLAAQLVPQAGETQAAGSFNYVNGQWVRQQSDGITHVPRGESAGIATKGFLDRLGYWAEDAAGIQQANDLIVTSGRRDIVNLPPAVTIPVTSTITINTSFVNFDARRATLDATGFVGDGVALKLTGSAALPFEQNVQSLRIPLLLGPGGTSTVDGLLLEGPLPVGPGPSRVEIVGANIKGFRNGLIFGRAAYLNVIRQGSIQNCGTCVWQKTAEDGFENNRLVQTHLFNSTLALKLDAPSADLHLDGCSLDALDRIAEISAGALYLNASHIEAVGGTPSFIGTPFKLTSEFARLILNGGSRRLPLGVTKLFDYWIEAAAGSIAIDAMQEAFADASRTGIFASGEGKVVRPGRIAQLEFGQNGFVFHETRSRVPDPAFGSLQANTVYVVPAGTTGYTQDSRYSEKRDGNVTNALSIAGSKLAANKQLGGGAPFTFALLLPAEAGELMGGRIFYDKPGAQTGTMFATASWVAVDPVPAGVIPNVTRSQSYATASVTVPSSSVPPTAIGFQPQASHRGPDWATHWMLTVSLSQMGAGDVFFSNPNFDRVG